MTLLDKVFNVININEGHLDDDQQWFFGTGDDGKIQFESSSEQMRYDNDSGSSGSQGHAMYQNGTKVLEAVDGFVGGKITTRGGDVEFGRQGVLTSNIVNNEWKFSAPNGQVSISEHSLADAGKAAVLGGVSTPLGIAVVTDATNGTMGKFYLEGGGNAVTILEDPDTAYTTTEDNDTTTNIYWDATNTQYEINNETGGTANYDVVYMGSDR